MINAMPGGLFLLASVVFLFLAGTLCGYAIGRGRTRQQLRVHEDRANRYANAVKEFEQWCGHLNPSFRLIGEQLHSVGEGLPLNAGTPSGCEPCTISGLREQLKRINTVSNEPFVMLDKSLQKVEGWVELLKSSDDRVLKSDVRQLIGFLRQDLMTQSVNYPSIPTTPQGEIQQEILAVLNTLYRRVSNRKGARFITRGKETYYLDKEQVLELLVDAMEYVKLQLVNNKN